MNSPPLQTKAPDHTLFSNLVHYTVKKIVGRYSESKTRDAYLAQVKEISYNVETALENITKLFFTHPIKSSLFLKGFLDWKKKYVVVQKENQHRDHFLVYNQLDHQIPFRPEEDTMYVYMLTQLALAAKELADQHPAKRMEKILHGILKLNQLGEEVFRTYPTIMPRFLDHHRLALKAVQKLDLPFNCCPSLHIAYSLLIDNLGPELFDEDIFAHIRNSTIRMFNSVLYTKQHSLMDVAFGMLCAKISYEENFPGRKFNNLTSCFDSLQAEHPRIAYSEIEHIFQQGVFLQKKGKTLTEIVGSYLLNNRYPCINPAQNDLYFHTEKKELVSFL